MSATALNFVFHGLQEMPSFPGMKEDAEVIGVLVRKFAEKNRLQEALSLLDEASHAGLRIRERYLCSLSEIWPS